MKNPKISVIIPVYNGEKKLYDCLNAIVRQTCKNYEVIVVNNNSTDATQLIIDDFKEKSSKVSSVFEPYKSRGAARNKGIERASGEIIAMLDVDCIAPNNWLTEITKPVIEENENVVVGFEEDLVRNFWTQTIQKNNWKYFNSLTYGKYIKLVDTKNFAIKASLMKKLMFNEKIGNGDDFELYMRLKKISKIRFLPNVRVGHYHPSSFWKFVTKQFDRGYWVKKIYDLHKNEKKIEHSMFEKIPLNTSLSGLKNMYHLGRNNPTKESMYSILEEVFWRAGILWSYIY